MKDGWFRTKLFSIRLFWLEKPWLRFSTQTPSPVKCFKIYSKGLSIKCIFYTIGSPFLCYKISGITWRCERFVELFLILLHSSHYKIVFEKLLFAEFFKNKSWSINCMLFDKTLRKAVWFLCFFFIFKIAFWIHFHEKKESILFSIDDFEFVDTGCSQPLLRRFNNVSGQ